MASAARRSVTVEIIAVEGLPEIRPGDNLGALIAACAPPTQEGDILVVAQKIVSKAEGRLRRLSTVTPSQRAVEISQRTGAEPALVEVVLGEAVRVVREDRVLIVETRQGFVCANAGVDRSNIPDADSVTLLPIDCDASAERLRARIAEISGVSIGVIISDTFGRPWRMGLCNVALGVAGTPAAVDYRGCSDDFGRELRTTAIAVADEVAAAAELVMGKTRRVPAVLVRGLAFDASPMPGAGRALVRPRALDLFQ